MNSRIAFAALAGLAVLAGCADTQEPDPAPAEDGGPYDRIDPTVNPVASEPLPPAGGEWVGREVDGRQGLVFQPLAGEPVFAMFCDERDGIVLERRGLLPSGPYRMMDVAVGNDRVSLAANEVDGPAVRATLPFNSEFHTRLADPGESISVTVGRSQPLMLPSTAEVAELVRTCTTAPE